MGALGVCSRDNCGGHIEMMWGTEIIGGGPKAPPTHDLGGRAEAAPPNHLYEPEECPQNRPSEQPPQTPPGGPLGGRLGVPRGTPGVSPRGSPGDTSGRSPRRSQEVHRWYRGVPRGAPGRVGGWGHKGPRPGCPGCQTKDTPPYRSCVLRQALSLSAVASSVRWRVVSEEPSVARTSGRDDALPCGTVV